MRLARRRAVSTQVPACTKVIKIKSIKGGFNPQSPHGYATGCGEACFSRFERDAADGAHSDRAEQKSRKSVRNRKQTARDASVRTG